MKIIVYGAGILLENCLASIRRVWSGQVDVVHGVAPYAEFGTSEFNAATRIKLRALIEAAEGAEDFLYLDDDTVLLADPSASVSSMLDQALLWFQADGDAAGAEALRITDAPTPMHIVVA